MRCAKCDTENRDAAKFCDKCGGRLLPACPSCGAENRPDAKFCDACGAALGTPSGVAAKKSGDPAIRTVQTPAAENLDGERKTGTRDPVVLNPDGAAIARGVRVKNEGDGTVWMQVTARGVPNEPLPAATQGLSVQREFLTLDGRPADLRRLRQNERLIVSISGRNLEGGYHEMALLDLLPAGFEIETVLTEEKAKSFTFLPKLTETRIAEGRDDRFFASLNLGRRTYRSWWDSDEELKRSVNSFQVAYVVRAVTPGSFALPAVNVSDMYAPRVYGRSAMGRVEIAPR